MTGILSLLSLLLLGVAPAWSLSPATEAPKTARGRSPEGAVVQGRFVAARDPRHQIPFAEFQIELLEQVELPDVDPPENWAEMTPEQRQQYLETFKATPEGKALIAQREAILAARNRFEIKIEADGRWTLYDVPPGRYALANGRVDREVDGIDYAYELFGQFDLAKEVDELQLDPIPVLVTPLFQTGDPAPPVDFPHLDENGAPWKTESLRGQPLVICFWSPTSPPSMEYLRQLGDAVDELAPSRPIQLLAIAIADSPVAVREKVDAEKLPGNQGRVSDWSDPVLDAYGVRSLPSPWLIGAGGEIRLTQFDFRRASISGQSLGETLQSGLDGTPPETPEGKGGGSE